MDEYKKGLDSQVKPKMSLVEKNRLKQLEAQKGDHIGMMGIINHSKARERLIKEANSSDAGSNRTQSPPQIKMSKPPQIPS